MELLDEKKVSLSIQKMFQFRCCPDELPAGMVAVLFLTGEMEECDLSKYKKQNEVNLKEEDVLSKKEHWVYFEKENRLLVSR